MRNRNTSNQELLEAARLGDEAGVAKALAAGASLEAKDIYGRTAAIFAAYHGHEPCLRALIASGADIEAKNKYGKTASMIAAENGHPEISKLIEEVVLSRLERAEMESALDLRKRLKAKPGRKSLRV